MLSGLFSIKLSFAIDVKAIRFFLNLISGEFMEPTPPSDLYPLSNYVVPKGQTEYNFLSFITYEDKKKCPLYDVTRFEQSGDGKKPPIKVTCMPGQGNGTLQIINSLKEVVALLAPYGNKTRRIDEGNCALVLFYTRSCTGSALVAPHFNAVSKQFPDIKIGAIDALRFHSLNTDFGIVGLPTVLLFHQGCYKALNNLIEYFPIILPSFSRSTNRQIQYDLTHCHSLCGFYYEAYWTLAIINKCLCYIRRLSWSSSKYSGRGNRLLLIFGVVIYYCLCLLLFYNVQIIYTNC